MSDDQAACAEVCYYDDGSDIDNYGLRPLSLEGLLEDGRFAVRSERPGGSIVLDYAALASLADALVEAAGSPETREVTVVFGDLVHLAPDGDDETWDRAQLSVGRDGEIVRIENLSEGDGTFGGAGVSFELSLDDALRLARLCGAQAA